MLARAPTHTGVLPTPAAKRSWGLAAAPPTTRVAASDTWAAPRPGLRQPLAPGHMHAHNKHEHVAQGPLNPSCTYAEGGDQQRHACTHAHGSVEIIGPSQLHLHACMHTAPACMQVHLQLRSDVVLCCAGLVCAGSGTQKCSTGAPSHPIRKLCVTLPKVTRCTLPSQPRQTYHSLHYLPYTGICTHVRRAWPLLQSAAPRLATHSMRSPATKATSPASSYH